MPLRVTDPTQWRPGATGLRWARHHSGGFEWELSPAASYIVSELWNHVKRGEHPPQRHVRKKLDPENFRENRLHFEWIALGLTVLCFWTAPKHSISGLESPVRLER